MQESRLFLATAIVTLTTLSIGCDFSVNEERYEPTRNTQPVKEAIQAAGDEGSASEKPFGNGIYYTENDTDGRSDPDTTGGGGQ